MTERTTPLTPKECLAFLNDTNDTIAQNACVNLGRAGQKRYNGALLRVLEGPRAALWMASAVGLTLLESKRATRRLLLVLDETRPEEQLYAATYALAFTSVALTDPRHRPAIVDAFIRLLGNPQIASRVRGIAAEGLGNLMGRCFGDAAPTVQEKEAITQCLTTALRDPEPEVRFWSAFALGAVGDPATVPALRILAEKDDAYFGNWWTVGEEASDAIDRIEGRPSPDRNVRAT